jgi:hypothetical protein
VAPTDQVPPLDPELYFWEIVVISSTNGPYDW